MNKYTKEEQYNLIKKDISNLSKIDNQYEDICLEAIRLMPIAIEYVKNQTEQLCLEAVSRNGYSIRYIKDKSPKLCFYAFLNKYNLIRLNQDNYIKNQVNQYMKNNPEINNKVFCLSRFKYKFTNYYFDINSLLYLKDFLLNKSHNTFVMSDKSDIELLKEIALSNNLLIIIDTGNINNIHTSLSNKIIKEEDL